jgi:hypothetical protein
VNSFILHEGFIVGCLFALLALAHFILQSINYKDIGRAFSRKTVIIKSGQNRIPFIVKARSSLYERTSGYSKKSLSQKGRAGKKCAAGRDWNERGSNNRVVSAVKHHKEGRSGDFTDNGLVDRDRCGGVLPATECARAKQGIRGGSAVGCEPVFVFVRYDLYRCANAAVLPAF